MSERKDPAVDFGHVLSLLPFGEGYRFVDTLERLDKDGALGRFLFREDLFFFTHHFPERPVVPGAILVECCAQAGVLPLGIWLITNEMGKEVDKSYTMAMTESTLDFLLPVGPGEEVQVQAERIYFRFGKLKCKVSMTRMDGTPICRGTMAGMLLNEQGAMRRVVITGLGICAPGALGIEAFSELLERGKSGITLQKDLEQLKFSCQIAGRPDVDNIDLKQYFNPGLRKRLNSNGLVYAAVAGMEAWCDAGMNPDPEKVDFDTGVIFGTGMVGTNRFRDAVATVDAGDVRRLGSTVVVQTMASAPAAYLGGRIAAGNQVTANSSACSTGTEALAMAFERVGRGQADRVLAGSTSDCGPYLWGGFDAMRILPARSNDRPTEGSRPMSASASGFVPGGGSGAYLVEDREQAIRRGARIYAEIRGYAFNSGGQRNGGSLTAPNPEAVQRAIRKALDLAGLDPSDIDTINGHLTATAKDPDEIRNWHHALGRPSVFPPINSFKGHLGHGLAASGSMELVGSILQIQRQQVFGNVNCHDLHDDIASCIGRAAVPERTQERRVRNLVKASFGFGDVNAVVVLAAPDS